MRRYKPQTEVERDKRTRVQRLHDDLLHNLIKSHGAKVSFQHLNGDYEYSLTVFNLNWTEISMRVSGNCYTDTILVQYRLASQKVVRGNDHMPDKDLELILCISDKTALVMLCRLITIL